MGNLILNRDFNMPDDGWYQLAPLGEFAHAATGVVQVIDQEACAAMAARFAAEAGTEPFDKLRAERFPGLLVDFDHFSLDGEKRSEAAGWITGLQARVPGAECLVLGPGHEDGAAGTPRPTSEGTGNAGCGLWAQIRWSDLGEAAVKGGRYRFLSPVWARSDCVDLGPANAGISDLTSQISEGMRRVRPVRLLNAAVTNDPNLKGMKPLSNASTALSAGRRQESGEVAKDESVDGVTLSRAKKGNGEKSMKAVIERLVNHLGLGADATEAVILEKMAGLPALTAVSELQNSLKLAQDERDALKGTLKSVEGELVNRHLAEFEGVVTETTKGFWTEQLVANRAGALIALGDLARLKDEGRRTNDEKKEEPSTKRPLHNRAAARPVPPGHGTGAATDGNSRAVRIRNRAQEIAAAEKVPFIVAFRRAEREALGQ